MNKLRGTCSSLKGKLSLLSAMVFMVLLITVSASCFVGAQTLGEVTLSWTAPTKNADGTTLTDLAGYNVYYGNATRAYTKNVNVGNILTYRISALTPGSWFFAVKSYDTSGNESDYSNEVIKTITVTNDTEPPASNTLTGDCTNITINNSWIGVMKLCE
jgi:hypothetical protein